MYRKAWRAVSGHLKSCSVYLDDAEMQRLKDLSGKFFTLWSRSCRSTSRTMFFELEMDWREYFLSGAFSNGGRLPFVCLDEGVASSSNGCVESNFSDDWFGREDPNAVEEAVRESEMVQQSGSDQTGVARQIVGESPRRSIER